MPRLFTGLEVPPEIGMLLSTMRGGLRGARWIDPENYHITLRFIGDVDEHTADEIADALDRVNRSPMPVTLEGLSSFGSKKPHSIYVRVAPDPEIMELQAEHERIMQRIGLAAEGRKFTPHVTVARCKGAAAADVAHWLSLRGVFHTTVFTARRFVLFSARASKGGGPYLVEEAYELNRFAA